VKFEDILPSLKKGLGIRRSCWSEGVYHTRGSVALSEPDLYAEDWEIMDKSQPKHTPGPWKITRYTNYSGFSIESESDPGYGCIAERWENIDNVKRNAERKANALLLAAAPLMLSALKEAYNEDNGGYSAEQVKKAILAAEPDAFDAEGNLCP